MHQRHRMQGWQKCWIFLVIYMYEHCMLYSCWHEALRMRKRCGNILYCHWKCFWDVEMLMSWKPILCFLAAHILSHCCFWVMFAHAPVWFPQTYKFKIIFFFHFGWHLILQWYTLHAYQLEHSGVSPKFCYWYSSVTVFKSNWAP